MSVQDPSSASAVSVDCVSLSRYGDMGTGEAMRRRQFITLMGGTAASWPLAVRAQQLERIRRIGVLVPLAADDPQIQSRLSAFREALQQLGWTDGRNVKIEYRYGGSDPDRSRRHAAELVALAPDVIFAAGN